MRPHLTFSQIGVLSSSNGLLSAKGSAGHGEGKNNGALQADSNVGPLPCGWYTIQYPPFRHNHCGEFCLRLIPDKENQMFGRSGFLIHGDNATGTASHGCIVQPRNIRELIVKEGFTRLQVVP